jgi:hypothetical protein
MEPSTRVRAADICSNRRFVQLSVGLCGDVLACGHVVLQGGIVTEGERDALVGEFDDLGVGLASGRPAVKVGRVGPPAVRFAMVEDPDRRLG